MTHSGLKCHWAPVAVWRPQNPFRHLYRDHDVEGMTDGFDEPTAYGHIDGIDDPSMGWARYAQVGKAVCHFQDPFRSYSSSLCEVWDSSDLSSRISDHPTHNYCAAVGRHRSSASLDSCSLKTTSELSRVVFDHRVIRSCDTTISELCRLRRKVFHKMLNLCAMMQATRHMNLNSGLFYLAANDRTLKLLDRVALRLSKEKVLPAACHQSRLAAHFVL